MAGYLYSIKENRLRRGLVEGFDIAENGKLTTMEGGKRSCFLCLRSIDGIEADRTWGRLWYDLDIPEHMVCYTYAAAVNTNEIIKDGKVISLDDYMTDPDISREDKKQFLDGASAMRFVNQKDILLYDLKGRYLYLVFEVFGSGKAVINHIKVDSLGDNFMNTFPEVYREYNSFFHRFLSIFSSIFNDFGEDIANLPQMLDLKTCPVEFLPLFGEWLGIDTGSDFFDEKILRTLVMEAHELCKMKGTKKALKRVADILLGDDVAVLETSILKSKLDKSFSKVYKEMFGDDPYGIVILTSKPVDDILRDRLMFVLDQFRPVKGRIRLVTLRGNAICNGHCYLDYNAMLKAPANVELDTGYYLDDFAILQ